VWGPSGQNLANLAKKGTELFIEGQLRQDRREDADTGQTRTKMYVKAQRWQFTQYRPKEQPEAGPQNPPQQEPASETPAAAEAIAEAPAPASKPKLTKRSGKKATA
jgi:single-stranded DNA-binding protein